MKTEKPKSSKKIRVTFSIPTEVNALLHAIVGKRRQSEFVTKALLIALEEHDSLKKAYAAANEDPSRKEVLAVLDQTEML